METKIKHLPHRLSFKLFSINPINAFCLAGILFLMFGTCLLVDAQTPTTTPAALPVEEPGVAGAATTPGANARPSDTPEMIAAALKDIPAPPAGPFGES